MPFANRTVMVFRNGTNALLWNGAAVIIEKFMWSVPTLRMTAIKPFHSLAGTASEGSRGAAAMAFHDMHAVLGIEIALKFGQQIFVTIRKISSSEASVH